MTWRTTSRFAILAAMAAGCGSPRIEAAPGERAPSIDLTPVPHEAMCVTKGEVAEHTITQPTVRAFGRGTTGDAAQLTFTFRGETATTRELASGDARRQLGLKLRAQDSCNVIYVMWRLDPKPRLDVMVKSNPLEVTHEDCGADGYLRVKPARRAAVPALSPGATHTLRAEIVGDDLTAWIDGKLTWQGRLPDEARAIAGPAGLRTDNLQLENVGLAAPKSTDGEGPACKRHEHDD